MTRSVVRVLAWTAALCAALSSWAAVDAQDANDQTLATGASPVIRIQARDADVTIRTWDRPEVLITSTQPFRALHFGPQAVERAFPAGDVAIFETSVDSPSGAVRLPQEDFPIDGMSGAPHDGVALFGGGGGASITITAPAASALVWMKLGRGNVHVMDYRGALVAQTHNGTIGVERSGGEAYLEAARGNVIVANSSFTRVRARTAIGSVLFSQCTVRQIEVNAVYGHIAFDNGTFAPGLARFETQRGNIAIGVASGGVQIGAHSANGRIISEFNRGLGDRSDAQATVNGGGPVVTASSGSGNVYLYSGSLRSKPQWQARLGAPRVPAMPKARTCAGRRCRP